MLFSFRLKYATMNLSEYLSQERGRQAALAKAIGAHAPDISKWATGERPIPMPYGAQIETATGGMVTRQEMFPDDWPRLWPELTKSKHRATDPKPPPGHRGRQVASPRHVLDTVPDKPITVAIKK